MSKADKMLEEIGIVSKFMGGGSTIELLDENGFYEAYLYLDEEDFTLNIDWDARNKIKFHLALHEKMKELGWFDDLE